MCTLLDPLVQILSRLLEVLLVCAVLKCVLQCIFCCRACAGGCITNRGLLCVVYFVSVVPWVAVGNVCVRRLMAASGSGRAT